MDSGNSNCSLQSSSGGEEEEEEEEYDSRPPNHQPSTLSSSNLMNPFGSLSNSSSSSHLHNDTASLFSNQHHPPSLLFDPNMFHTTFSHHHTQQQQQQAAAASFLNLDMLPSSSQLQNQMLRSGPTSASSSSPHDPPPSHAIGLLRSHNHRHPHPSSSIITPHPPMPYNNYSTTSTSTVPPAAGVGGGRNSNHHNNNPNPNQRSGHVASRNPKKRTRASRRAPTTVLTTDTSNFRAMVQEFTGIPPPPFSTPYSRSTFDLFRSNQFDATTTTTTATMTSLLYPLRPSPHKLPPFGSDYLQVGSSDLHQTAPSMMNQMLSALTTVPNKSQSTPAPVALTSLDHDIVDHHQWGDAVVAHHMPSNTSHIINQDHHDDDHKDNLDNLTSSRDHQGTFDSWSCPTTTTD